jgi:hypothetical protein
MPVVEQSAQGTKGCDRDFWEVDDRKLTDTWFSHPRRQKAACTIRKVDREMQSATVINGPQNRNPFTYTRMMRIMDVDL